MSVDSEKDNFSKVSTVGNFSELLSFKPSWEVSSKTVRRRVVVAQYKPIRVARVKTLNFASPTSRALTFSSFSWLFLPER